MSSTAYAIQGTQPDYSAIKSKQQATWASGDYGRIGVTLQITGESLCEAMDLRSGRTLLDVAAGNGNASLAAARRFCRVVSTDYVPALSAQCEKRARVESLPLECRHADAEDLPFADGAFDYVVSTFGVMFAPNQARAASELLRVCRPGGRIGLANWTPDGFIGQLFRTIGKHLPPPAGLHSPARWGAEDFLAEHFGAHAAGVEINRRVFNFRYQSPQHWLDVFATWYGPTLKAFEALGETRGLALRTDILALIDALNLADDGSMVVPSEYLEVVVTR